MKELRYLVVLFLFFVLLEKCRNFVMCKRKQRNHRKTHHDQGGAKCFRGRKISKVCAHKNVLLALVHLFEIV